MEMQYFKEYSPELGRDMECKLYGQQAARCCISPVRTADSSILKTST